MRMPVVALSIARNAINLEIKLTDLYHLYHVCVSKKCHKYGSILRFLSDIVIEQEL